MDQFLITRLDNLKQKFLQKRFFCLRWEVKIIWTSFLAILSTPTFYYTRLYSRKKVRLYEKITVTGIFFQFKRRKVGTMEIETLRTTHDVRKRIWKGRPKEAASVLNGTLLCNILHCIVRKHKPGLNRREYPTHPLSAKKDKWRT